MTYAGVHSQPVPARTHSRSVIPVFLSSYIGFFPASYLSMFYAVLCVLPRISCFIDVPSCLHILSSLFFLPHFLTHLLSFLQPLYHLFTPILFSRFYSRYSHLSIRNFVYYKYRASKRILKRIKSR